jgi:hypothetical protein
MGVDSVQLFGYIRRAILKEIILQVEYRSEASTDADLTKIITFNLTRGVEYPNSWAESTANT